MITLVAVTWYNKHTYKNLCLPTTISQHDNNCHICLKIKPIVSRNVHGLFAQGLREKGRGESNLNIACLAHWPLEGRDRGTLLETNQEANNALSWLFSNSSSRLSIDRFTAIKVITLLTFFANKRGNNNTEGHICSKAQQGKSRY